MCLLVRKGQNSGKVAVNVCPNSGEAASQSGNTVHFGYQTVCALLSALKRYFKKMPLKVLSNEN
jgi:hypothetical protein